MYPYIAKKGQAASPEVEAIGAALGTMINNIRAEEVKMVLMNYELADIDLQRWYPQQLLLDIFRAVEGQYGEFSENLVAIGIQAIDAFAFPETVTDIESAVQFLQGVYQMTHRNHPPPRKVGTATQSVAMHTTSPQISPIPTPRPMATCMRWLADSRPRGCVPACLHRSSRTVSRPASRSASTPES